MHKKTIEYKFKRGDTVYFIHYDRMQCTTVEMVLAVIESKDHTAENKEHGLMYVLDNAKIIRPEKKKYERGNVELKTHYSVGELFSTPQEASQDLINKMNSYKEETDNATKLP